jgi:hypothetical protein
MRLRCLVTRAGVTGTLLLAAATCGGWKWNGLLH